MLDSLNVKINRPRGRMVKVFLIVFLSNSTFYYV